MTRFGRLSTLDPRPDTETTMLICEGYCNPNFHVYIDAQLRREADEASVRRKPESDTALLALRALARDLAYTPHVPHTRRRVESGDAVSIEMECCLCGSVRRFGLEAV